MIAIDDAAVVAEVTAASEDYEFALARGDVQALVDAFWDDPRAIRIGDDEELFGFDSIERFRWENLSGPVERERLERSVVAFGPDVATVTLVTRYPAGAGRIGRQSQLWLRTGTGWRVAQAHVSWPLRSTPLVHVKTECGTETP